MNLIPLSQEQEDYLYFFDSFPLVKEKIKKQLELMLFYIDKIDLNENIRFNQKIDRLIKKLETAKKKGTIKQLQELERIYMKTNKYVVLSTSCEKNDSFFTKLPLYDGQEDIDKQIYFLEKCKKERLLKEKEYVFVSEDDSIYYTLLENLKSEFKVPYKERDVILITLSHIYAVLKTNSFDKPLQRAKDLLGDLIEDFISYDKEIYPADFNDIKFNVYRLSYEDSYYEVSQIFLDDYGKPYYDFEKEPDLILNKYYDIYQKKWIKKYLFFGDYKGGVKRYKCLNIDSDKYFR